MIPMISSNSTNTSSGFLLLSHLSMVFNCNWKCFWLTMDEVNLTTLSTVMSSFLGCFYKIKVSFCLVLYEWLILEFKRVSFSTDWARQCSSSSCWLSHRSFWEIVQTNIEVSASCWRFSTVQNLWCEARTLLCLNFSFKNINKFVIFRFTIWTFVHMRSSLCWNRCLSFILIRLLNKWFDSGVDLVILLLLFLLTNGILECSNRVELTHCVLVEFVNAFECSFSYGFLMIS